MTPLRDKLGRICDSVYDRELQITYAIDQLMAIIEREEKKAVAESFYRVDKKFAQSIKNGKPDMVTSMGEVLAELFPQS